MNSTDGSVFLINAGKRLKGHFCKYLSNIYEIMPSVRFKRFKFVAILFQTEPCVQIFLAPKFRRKIIFFIEFFFFCLCLRLTTTQGYYHIQLSIVKLINFLHRRRLTAMKSDQLFKTSYNGSSAFVNLFLILYRRGLKLTFFIRQSWKPQVPWEWFANFGRTYVSEMPNVVLAETNFLRSLSLDCKVPHRI